MKFWSNSFIHNGPIHERNAFGKFDANSHCVLSSNLNPHFAWSELPEKTKSLALICVDRDVPSCGDNVNQEGKVVSRDLKRVNFFHWGLANISPLQKEILEGTYSKAVIPRGKSGPNAMGNTSQALNDYTRWFEGDAEMAGAYYGYDGPCPPWNDEKIHHYFFNLYALSVASIPMPDLFEAGQLLAVIKPHILDSATWVGTYAINPKAT